jgi:hypothetical protein
MIQPDSMADDLGGRSMAVMRVGWGFHTSSLLRLRFYCWAHLP